MNLHITLTCSHGRMCILIYIILAHQGHFTIEQPSTSLLFRHPRFQQIISLVKESWFQIATYFGYHQKNVEFFCTGASLGCSICLTPNETVCQ